MTITVQWRQTSTRAHLATPGNHRGLCGADVLSAPHVDTVGEHDICRLCADHAFRYLIDLPPVEKAPRRDPDTISLGL